VSSPTPGPDHNPPRGGAAEAEPGWGSGQQTGYGPHSGYTPAPAYSGAPTPTGRRPGTVLGLLVLVSVTVSAALLWAGIQVMQGKSPRLLLLISYVAIGINLLTMIIGIAQGASIFGYLLGFVIPGVVVFLLMNAQSKQHYAARGISY
jgi:hypothetical protein